MHSSFFFQFFFSLVFSFFFVGAHGMVFLIKFHCLYSWSCFSHYVLTILVFVELISLITKSYFWYSYSVYYSNRGRLGFGSNPLSKHLQQKKGLNTCQYETNQQNVRIKNTIDSESASSGHVFHFQQSSCNYRFFFVISSNIHNGSVP